MIEDDLWADLADDIGDAEVSSESIVQKKDTSAKDTATTEYSKSTLKKVTLKKVDEEASNGYISRQVEQKPLLLSYNTINADSNNQARITSLSHLPSSSGRPFVPKLPLTEAAIQEDLWSDNTHPEQLSFPDSPPTAIENPALLNPSAPNSEFDTLVSSDAVVQISSDLDIELDDLWVTSDDPQILAADEDLSEEWNDTESFFVQEEEINAGDSLTNSLPLELEKTADLLVNLENFFEPDSIIDGFEFIDIKAELAELERVEEELASQNSEFEPATKAIDGRGSGQAPGWMGSSSVLYIDWEDKEKAEQDALERLGYSGLKLSEATRTFVIQSAQAGKLTRSLERLLISQLTDARLRLARLPGYDAYEQQRSEIKGEIAKIEQILTYNLQWMAVKKARNFLGQGIELDDLIQYAMLGVVAGIRHFDLNRQTRLIVVVNWWVFQALSRAVAENERIIRLPVYIQGSLANIKKHRIELDILLGHLPTHEELAAAVHMPIKRLEELLSADKIIFSLEHYVRAECINDGYSFQPIEDALVLSEVGSIDYEIERLVINQNINAILNCLTARERKVIRLRYDLDNDNGDMRTLEEVGKEMHVTRERVRQIEDRAFKKMRGHLHIQTKKKAQIVNQRLKATKEVTNK